MLFRAIHQIVSYFCYPRKCKILISKQNNALTKKKTFRFAWKGENLISRLVVSQDTMGTIFSLRSRRRQDTYLSLELAGSDLKLIHAASNGTDVVRIPTRLTDGQWHQIAIRYCFEAVRFGLFLFDFYFWGASNLNRTTGVGWITEKNSFCVLNTLGIRI